ncbi:MAG: HD domain-containing protein [Candidatus Gastranaerophilales bacterium]|nr:HD domain-containing protein [Candidatus Gastranaerophilales bacterium]
MEFEQFSQQEIEELYHDISKGWNDRLAHVSRVYHLCQQFLKEYPEANRRILLVAALLHDIGHSKEGDHALNGALMVKEILADKKFNLEEIENISNCIKTHSLKGLKQPQSIEGKILSDCDRIDVINIDNWLGVIDSKIVKGGDIIQAVRECEEWEKEWFLLGTKFHTTKGKIEYEKIQKRKREIADQIRSNSLKILRRGILIHFFDENLEKVLLVKRTNENEWGVIAGTSEENEEFIRTAVREFKEEANINRFLFELFPSDLSLTINFKVRSLDILHHYCAKKKSTDSPQINFPEEICEVSWYYINNLPENMIPTNVKSNLMRFIENDKRK